MQSSKWRDQVPVTHPEFLFQVLKRPAHPGGQQRHDSQPPFFVNGFVEFVEVEHCSFESWFSREPGAPSRPGESGVNEVKQAKRGSHCRQRHIEWKIFNQVV